MNNAIDWIIEKYNEVYILKEYEDLSKYTTLRLGGKARLFIQVQPIFPENVFEQKDIEAKIRETTIPLQELIKDLIDKNVRFHILGGGSDTLFSDDLYDGVVIKITANRITVLDDLATVDEQSKNEEIPSRHVKLEHDDGRKVLDFDSLYFDENHSHPVYVYADAGVMLSFFIITTLMKNLSGMHWFSHIPAALGGAVYNNIHGGKVMFSEYIKSVIIIDKYGEIHIINKDDMSFGYDNSRIQHNQEIVIGIIFRLYKEDDEEIKKSKYFSEKWIEQKIQIQPKFYSAGSTFKNISEEDKKRLNLPTNSAGYLIDQVGLKGYHIGGAQIYENHGNFFINNNNATSAEYKQLIDFAIQKVNEKFGIIIEPEIKCINFSR